MCRPYMSLSQNNTEGGASSHHSNAGGGASSRHDNAAGDEASSSRHMSNTESGALSSPHHYVNVEGGAASSHHDHVSAEGGASSHRHDHSNAEGGASSSSPTHKNQRLRVIRHSYEEVDIDLPDPTAAAATREGAASGHSYEEVDFNYENGVGLGGVASASSSEVRVQHQQGPARINSLSHTIRRLRMCGWYWGDISSEQAREVLRRAQNGSFILRDSSDACHLFTLSLKASNIIVSVRVAFSRGLFKLDSWNQEDSPSFSSVVDMIEYYLEDESHEFYVELPNMGEFPVCLKHPIWKEVPELQHLCRTTVVKYCRTSDKLRLLPLPPHLIRYVLEFSPEDSTGDGDSGRGRGGGVADGEWEEETEEDEEEGSRGNEDSSPTVVMERYPVETTA